MTYALIRESWPVARKPHKCIWCGDRIPVGEQHRHEVSRYDELQDHRWHRDCHEDATEHFRQGEGEFSPYDNERPAARGNMDKDDLPVAQGGRVE